MANVNSIEYTKQVAVPPTLLDTTEQHGRIRVATFGIASHSPSANDTVNLIKMPAGKVRILKLEIQHSAYATGATLDVGHGGYTDMSNAAIAAVANEYADNLAMDNTTDISKIINETVESKSGFTLTGLFQTAGGTTETLYGFITYVVD